MTQDGSSSCHFCHQSLRDVADAEEDFPRVSSDCRPARRTAGLVVCPACGLTQTRIGDAWRRQATETYDGYEIYATSQGEEQKVASDEGFCGRSQVLVDNWSATGRLGTAGKLLDVGCGNGSFLRAFSAKFPQWELHGSETSDRYVPRLREMPNFREFFGGDPAAITGTYDAPSLVHVLEHIEEPGGFLQVLRGKAVPGAQLLVEVPAWRSNPFALMIADHASHFTPESLRMVVGTGGWRGGTQVAEAWVPKELSLLAGNAPDDPQAEHPMNAGDEDAALRRAVGWLGETMARGRRLAEGSRCFGLFGTAIAATWLYQGMPDAVEFFVDEDPQRVGRTHLGLPIVAPGSEPEGSDVFAGVSPLLSAKIAGRLDSPRCRYHAVTD